MTLTSSAQKSKRISIGGPWRVFSAYFLVTIVLLAGAGCATTRIATPRGVAPIEREMTVTGYCKCKKCCNWRRNWLFRPVVASGAQKGKHKKVGVTASGAKARHGSIAADTAKYPFGTVMEIPGYGRGKVTDKGTAIQGEHIDLFFGSHKEALRWGNKTLKVRIWLAPK